MGNALFRASGLSSYGEWRSEANGLSHLALGACNKIKMFVVLRTNINALCCLSYYFQKCRGKMEVFRRSSNQPKPISEISHT